MAMTNVLIKTKPSIIFSSTDNLLQLLTEYSIFEQDNQMHLRFIYLVYLALSKAAERELVPQEKLQPLIDFLLTNIHKFRIILDCKDSYAVDIPKKDFFEMNGI